MTTEAEPTSWLLWPLLRKPKCADISAVHWQSLPCTPRSWKICQLWFTLSGTCIWLPPVIIPAIPTKSIQAPSLTLACILVRTKCSPWGQHFVWGWWNLSLVLIYTRFMGKGVQQLSQSFVAYLYFVFEKLLFSSLLHLFFSGIIIKFLIHFWF